MSRKVYEHLLFHIFILVLVLFLGHCRHLRHRRGNRHFRLYEKGRTQNPYTKTICMQSDNTIRGRHKTCFLRPDTGPCRADILQWYFDVKQRTCYRFFWGGCQGNGNRFDTQAECLGHCYINFTSPPPARIPYFCSLSFDYGSCFGHFNRWGWDKLYKTCKRRLYSGCGGNQNNFESQDECMKTCLTPPNNTFSRFNRYTTCVPFVLPEMN